ncbi:MAG: DUF2764 family protein [Gammaproteobacteria bacterium]
MIPNNCKYAMLIASLPKHPVDLFSAKHATLSSLQLQRRLALLDTHDADDLARMESVLHWSEHLIGTDAEVIVRGEAVLAQIRNDFLRHVIVWRLEQRTLLGALRRRQLGMPPPQPGSGWGFGQWLPYVEANWEVADFGLGARLPWLVPMQELLADGKTLELEKWVLNLIWKHYARQKHNHFFDFEAVVIYVFRWDIINRWLHYDRQQAETRFDELVRAGLGEFGSLL